MKVSTILSLLASMALLIPLTAAENGGRSRQYYELRVYHLENEEQRALVNDYWEKAGIPAYNRAGVQQIGVFTETDESPTNRIYVLIPFDSLGTFESLRERLAEDAEYQKAAESFMNRSRNDAPYRRVESSLLHAMTGMPKLAIPPSSAKKDPWIFELRTYFSPTEAKGANKIDMFNAGEIDIMKEVGLHPVFFAGTVVGPQMPSLVYMTSGANMEDYRKAWRGFGPHPQWKKLMADPLYKNNMSGSQSVFLKRTSASQI